MKLRNLMYATMIACAFSSCSKDDETNPDNGGVNGKTVLEIRANALSTKVADTDITSLTLIVADAVGTIEKIETTTNGAAGAMSRKTEVTPGQKQVLVLANVTVPESTATLAAVSALTNSIGTEVDGALSMNSAIYKITVTANVTNYLGYESKTEAGAVYLTEADAQGVKLYRNVAKVVLSKIAVFESLGEGNTQYPNASLKVTGAYILNGREKTSFAPANGAEWGETQSTTGAWVGGFVCEADAANKFKVEAIETAFGKFATTYSGEEYTISADADKAFGTSFYVYENYNTSAINAAAKTLLVIKGDFSYDTWSDESEGKKVRHTESDRYYTIAIGRTGFETTGFALPTGFTTLRGGAAGINGAEAGKGFDVLRNLQYNVSLTVKGMGYKTPGGEGDSQILDVKVRVVPFGEVDQDVEI